MEITKTEGDKQPIEATSGLKQGLGGLEFELWSAAQLAPGEGIEDGAQRIARMLAPIKGSRDMLRESAKQHRARGDGDGHGSMCDLHADVLDKMLTPNEPS